MKRLLLLLGFLGAISPCTAHAHELRPGYLELRQTAPDTLDLLFKVPALGEALRLGIYVSLPEGTQEVVPPRAEFAGGAYVERRTVKRDGGFTGERIAIEGLSATLTDVLVRVEKLGGTTQTERLTPTRTEFTIKATPAVGEVALTYLVLGVEHILTGIDHLLFVLALLIIVRGGWQLVKTITAFTLAHSITLALATLGFVDVPPKPVEAVIALSIAVVAAEIVYAYRRRPGLAQRAPWILAFAFGLLHGLGFAGALREVGLPSEHIPAALLFFNLGVEAGQLAFVGAILALVWIFRSQLTALPRWTRLLPPYAIGSVAMFWVIQRVAVF